jgi:hypothetical protein
MKAKASVVIPAKAGTQVLRVAGNDALLGPRFRGDDEVLPTDFRSKEHGQ